MSKYFVGIDEGTTGTKTCIFDERGHLVSSAYEEYGSYYPMEGYVEQEISEITNAIFRTCKSAIQKAKIIDKRDIEAVSLSSQGASCILLDAKGQPVRNRMIGWQDLRHIEIYEDIINKITDEEHYKIEGSPINGFNTGVLVWIQKKEPEIWKRTKRIATNQDYFLHVLGAKGYPCDLASAHRISMLDVNKGEWSYRLRNAYGCDDIKLPEVISDPGKIVGEISADIEEKTGLPYGCKICLGAQDINCSSFGVGGIEDNIATMVVGTFGGSYMVIDKPIRDPKRTIIVKGNQGMNNWQLEAFSHTAASALRWFRDEFFSQEIEESKLTKKNLYSKLIEIAENSEPGSNGVIALTFLQGSHGRKVNSSMRGTFLGISLGTKKADIIRSILEGICFEMYDILLLQESFSKSVDRVRLSGGVTKSSFWCQMFADIFEKKIELCESPEASALGAMMYAGIGIELFKDCYDAVKKCVRVTKVFYPNPDTSLAYKKAYEKWNKAFNALDESFYGEK